MGILGRREQRKAKEKITLKQPAVSPAKRKLYLERNQTLISKSRILKKVKKVPKQLTNFAASGASLVTYPKLTMGSQSDRGSMLSANHRSGSGRVQRRDRVVQTLHSIH